MKFSTAQWIAWLGATLVAAVTMIVGAYGQFETKESSRERAEVLKESIVEIKQDVREIKSMLQERRR